MQFVSFDIETTGFMAGADQIVELAAVRFRDGKPVETYSTLVDPQMQIPMSSQRIHGITDQMVQGQPRIEKVLEGFANFCSQDILVAHNAPFDAEFISSDIKRFETPAPQGIILDSCQMARKVVQGLTNYRLGTLVQHLQIPCAEFHRAEADARYCGYLFSHMLQKVFNGGQPIVIENLINLSGGQALKFPQVTKTPKQLDFMSALSL